MKKALLVTLLATMLVCVFALCVSATGFESSFTNEVTKYYAEDGKTELIPDWADLSDKNATAVIRVDGTCVRIPLYYIYQCNNSTELRHEIRTATGSAGFRYEWITEKLGKTVNHANLVAIDIPEGIKTTSGFGSYTALEEIIFPLSATAFPKSESNKTIKKVFAKQAWDKDGKILGITEICNQAFKNVATLEYFKLELDYVTKIGANILMGTSIKELRLEGPLTAIGGAPFSGCKQLETVYLNNTSDSPITLPNQAFKGDANLSSVTSNNFSLGKYLFENVNGAPGTLTVVATNVASIGEYTFKNATNLETAEITGPITSIGGNVFSGCSSLESAIIRVIGDTFSDKASVGGISSIVSKGTYEGNKSAYATGSHIIYGYNICELNYGGVHTEPEGIKCVAPCAVCGSLMTAKNPVHTSVNNCVYANGYLNEGKYIVTCAIEGCKYSEEKEVLDAIIEFVGYSTPEKNADRLTVSYAINQDAIKKYNELTNSDLNIGLVASFADVTENIEPVKVVDGNVVASYDKTVCVPVSTNYTGVDFIISGFNSSETNYCDTSLVLCAYIVEGEKVDYICYDSEYNKVQSEYATTITLNTVADIK